MSLICVPIRARTFLELKSKVRRAEKYADILEIWADSLDEKITPAHVLAVSPKKKLIVSKRPGILKEFLKSGADFIDIDEGMAALDRKELLAAKGRAKIIISYHNTSSTPRASVLWQKIKKSFALGADIVKIATTAKKMDDNLVIMQLLVTARRKRLPLIAHCMGKKGRASRLLGSLFDSHLIYVALDAKNRTAPGQLTAHELEIVKILTPLLP